MLICLRNRQVIGLRDVKSEMQKKDMTGLKTTFMHIWSVSDSGKQLQKYRQYVITPEKRTGLRIMVRA